MSYVVIVEPDGSSADVNIGEGMILRLPTGRKTVMCTTIETIGQVVSNPPKWNFTYGEVQDMVLEYLSDAGEFRLSTFTEMKNMNGDVQYWANALPVNKD